MDSNDDGRSSDVVGQSSTQQKDFPRRAAKVFNTTELCQLILSHLSTKDLLFAQLIYRKINAIIQESSKLQI